MVKRVHEPKFKKGDRVCLALDAYSVHRDLNAYAGWPHPGDAGTIIQVMPTAYTRYGGELFLVSYTIEFDKKGGRWRLPEEQLEFAVPITAQGDSS